MVVVVVSTMFVSRTMSVVTAAGAAAGDQSGCGRKRVSKGAGGPGFFPDHSARQQVPTCGETAVNLPETNHEINPAAGPVNRGTKAAFESGSARPRPLAVSADTIPAELKALAQWVTWRYDWREGKWSKVLLNPQTGFSAKTDTPATWGTFEQALAHYRKFTPEVAGVGFVFTAGDDFAGVDLDDAIDPATGKLKPWAAAIVADLDSYTETSPSGTGVKVFVKAKKPGSLCAKKYEDGKVEIYDHGRYFCLTGIHWAGTPGAVEARQEPLERLYNRVFKRKDMDGPQGDDEKHQHGDDAQRRDEHQQRGEHHPADDHLTDADILDLASRAGNSAKFKALMNGDTSMHGGDDSAADLSLMCILAFYTKDAAQLERLFGLSKLADRPKWRKRADYRNRTIARALEQVTESYQPPRKATSDRAPGAGTNQQQDHQPDRQDIHATDLGNARRIVARHGRDLRYVHAWKTWLVWDGRRWAEDCTGEAMRRAKETAGALFRTAVAWREKLADKDDEQSKAEKDAAKKLLAHALRWEDARDLGRSLELARSEPGVPVVPDDLDRDPFLLNVQNGTLDLRTGKLRGHRRTDLLTKLAPLAFDEHATCELWQQCLSRWMDGNRTLCAYLQRVVGYALTADVSEQCLWFFHGNGANGKSTFLLTIQAMLGDYAMQAVSDLLIVKHNDPHPTERADLFGKRFVATIETDEGKRLAEALMKQLTGGDRLQARKTFKDFFEFDATWKIVLAANHKPQVRGTDHAAWRRIKMVPWTVTIPDNEKDKNLAEKLKRELPGVLTWAVAGCLDWQESGLGEPEEVRDATKRYREEQDAVGRFIDECCCRIPAAKVKVAVLYEAYGRWSGDKLMTQPAFNDRLRAMGFESERSTYGYFWQGLGLAGGGPDETSYEPL
jgi:putative DNA primase/helicase